MTKLPKENLCCILNPIVYFDWPTGEKKAQRCNFCGSRTCKDCWSSGFHFLKNESYTRKSHPDCSDPWKRQLRRIKDIVEE